MEVLLAVTQLKSSEVDGDALAYWQDVVCDLFVPLSCSTPSESRFGWSFASEGLGDLRFVDMTVTPHLVRHTRQHVGKSSEPYFILSQQVSGPGVIVQDSREAVLEPGDLALYDSTRAYELRFAGPMRQRIVRIPQHLITDKLTNVERLTARPVRAHTPLGSLCSNFITSSFELMGQLGSAGPTVSNTLTDLLSAALRDGENEARLDDAVSARVLRRRVLAYIEHNLSDPELNVEQIAQAMRLSSRYIHMLMKGVGTTPATLIWSRRLERCAEALSDPDMASVPVSQVAYAWGYKDAAHFTRSFKTRFGISPREFRARV
ncbi:MAG: helix-turn-helix domain-containing protein [Sphingomonadaceae bacterium]|nr:helix-turn-helix domain-containing protein [Sphingomonadaceae bacterium]